MKRKNKVNSNHKKIRFFKYFRSCCGAFGFRSHRSLLNGRTVLGICLIWLAAILNSMFLIFEANTLWDYMNSFYISLGATVAAIFFTMFVIDIRKIFDIIDFFEEMFQNSE